MKHSFVVLAFAGFFLATSLNNSQADPPKDLPVPSGPDVPDTHYKGGGDNVPSPNQIDRWRVKPVRPETPGIISARMENGRVRFTFGGSGEATMRYNIRWSRPGKAEVNDMRWYTGRPLEEYIINESPLWGTVYFFRVQAEGKSKLKESDGIYRYPLTNFVGLSFRTPPNPAITDRVNVKQNYGTLPIPSPTKPRPIIGK